MAQHWEMEEWLVSALLAAALVYYIMRPKVTKIPVTTQLMKPAPPSASPKPANSTNTHISFQSPEEFLPSPGPMPVPPAIPLLSTSLAFPPYYHKQRIPTFSACQQLEAQRLVYSQLQAQPDEEEVSSVQQLLTGSYWTAPAIDQRSIDGAGMDQHRGALGKILKALIAIAKEEKAKLPVYVPDPVPPVAQVAVPTEPLQPPPQQVLPQATSSVGDNLEAIRKEMEETVRRRGELPSLPSELNGDLNEIIGQITSDVSDFQHLSHCAQRCLASIQRFPQATEIAIYSLSEKVLNQCRVNVEDIENGPSFALNYTNFIMEVSQQHPNIQRIFRDLLYSKRKILVPTLITDPQDIDKRLHLQDVQPDAFESQMNLTRAFGSMRAALNCHGKSRFGVKEGWVWLARLINLPIEQVDRLTIPALTGFVKVVKLRKALQGYGVQGRKLVALLKKDYFPTIKSRFWGENQLYHTSIAMLERAITDLVSDFP